MLTPNEITAIYCYVDDFCQEFDKYLCNHSNFLPFEVSGTPIDYSSFSLSPSEVITLLICFQHSSFRNLKSFYQDFACQYLIKEFPNLPSYNRFVELQQMSVFHNFFFTKFCCCSPCDGISFIDSFKLQVCHNKRILQHKVFLDLAQRGHTSMGYFYGFKGHIVINSECQIIDFQLTPGNVADNDQDLLSSLCSNLFGKVFGDKGYILNEQKMRTFMEKGVQFVSKIRRNMKNKLIDIESKFMLKRRTIVETVIDQLKNICHIDHTRHRSPINFLNNFYSAIAAYFFKSDKPRLKSKSQKSKNYNPLQLCLEF